MKQKISYQCRFVIFILSGLINLEARAVQYWKLPLILTFGLLGGTTSFAQDVEIEIENDISHCKTYSWFQSEKLPIIDAMIMPGSKEAQSLEKLDVNIRKVIEEKLAKKKWRLQPSGSAVCEVRYSLYQDLDLTVMRHEPETAAPRSTRYSGLTGAGSDTHLARRGEFILEILSADSQETLWQAAINDTIGKPKDSGKKVRKLAEKVLDALP